MLYEENIKRDSEVDEDMIRDRKRNDDTSSCNHMCGIKTKVKKNISCYIADWIGRNLSEI